MESYLDPLSIPVA